MGGKMSRDKGGRGEREIVHLLRDAGIPAKRVPLSGAAPGFKGDVLIGKGSGQKTAEVKRRAKGFRELYKWLEGADILFIRADRRQWLAVLPLDDLKKLMQKIEK